MSKYWVSPPQRCSQEWIVAVVCTNLTPTRHPFVPVIFAAKWAPCGTKACCCRQRSQTSWVCGEIGGCSGGCVHVTGPIPCTFLLLQFQISEEGRNVITAMAHKSKDNYTGYRQNKIHTGIKYQCFSTAIQDTGSLSDTKAWLRVCITFME